MALFFIPSRSRPKPEPIDDFVCDEIGPRAFRGLPYYHKIYKNIRITEENPHIVGLQKEDIHRFWHLDRNLITTEPDLAILDPHIAKPKGRPALRSIVRLREAIMNTQVNRDSVARSKKPQRAGGRATKRGGGLAPSQRRDRSHWEEAEAARPAAAPRRTRATRQQPESHDTP